MKRVLDSSLAVTGLFAAIAAYALLQGQLVDPWWVPMVGAGLAAVPLALLARPRLKIALPALLGGVMTWLYATGMAANRLGDWHLPEEHRVGVLAIDDDVIFHRSGDPLRGKRTVFEWVIVASWRGPGQERIRVRDRPFPSVDVPRDATGRFDPTRKAPGPRDFQMVVSTRGGALGLAWVSGYRFIAPEVVKAQVRASLLDDVRRLLAERLASRPEDRRGKALAGALESDWQAARGDILMYIYGLTEPGDQPLKRAMSELIGARVPD